MHARVKAATKGIEHAHIPGDAKEALARRQAQKAELERQLKNYEDGRPKPEAFGAGSILGSYVRLGDQAYHLVNTTSFELFITAVICIACVLVGISTYDGLADSDGVAVAEAIVIGIFLLEILLKLVADSTRPWLFFTGMNWKWNNFDFLICLLCLPILPFGGAFASVLRMARLLRILKLVKSVQGLQVLMGGIVGGLNSIGYMLIMVLLVMFMYGVLGVMLFRDNDQTHWSDLATAFVTLFRVATLEDWTDVLYINYYGCDKYAGGPVCSAPSSKPVTAIVFFVSFIFVESFIMLSMFVGAIISSMTETIEMVNEEANEAARQRLIKRVEMKRSKSSTMLRDQLAQVQRAVEAKLKHLSVEERNQEMIMGAKLRQAMEGKEQTIILLKERTAWRRAYSEFADVCKAIVGHWLFERIVIGMIVATAFLVGMLTDEGLERNAALKSFTSVWDWFVALGFTFEFLLKLCAKKFRPLDYYKDPWNCFDFVVMIGSWSGGELFFVLRTVRLLLVLKAVRRVPALRVAVGSLLGAVSSMGLIGVTLSLTFFFFGVFGCALFKENDPTHFKNLHTAMITLLRCATLDDWTDVMYINMYGCSEYGYPGGDDGLNRCEHSKPLGTMSVIFFVIFILVGSMVMLNLFIGVISAAMEESMQQLKEEAELREELFNIKEQRGLTDDNLRLFEDVYKHLDVDNSNGLEMEELLEGVKSAYPDREPDLAAMQELFMEIDANADGSLDLAEFVTFMSQSLEGNSGHIMDARAKKASEGEGGAGSRLVKQVQDTMLEYPEVLGAARAYIAALNHCGAVEAMDERQPAEPVASAPSTAVATVAANNDSPHGIHRALADQAARAGGVGTGSARTQGHMGQEPPRPPQQQQQQLGAMEMQRIYI